MYNIFAVITTVGRIHTTHVFCFVSRSYTQTHPDTFEILIIIQYTQFKRAHTYTLAHMEEHTYYIYARCECNISAQYVCVCVRAYERERQPTRPNAATDPLKANNELLLHILVSFLYVFFSPSFLFLFQHIFRINFGTASKFRCSETQSAHSHTQKRTHTHTIA